jgi:4-hydroxy-tetrahydrodipicolinate reductase
MSLRICIAGVTGWVGSPLARAVENAGDMELISAVSRSNSGKQLREAVEGTVSEFIVSGSVREALAAQPDVFVDYTSATAVNENVLEAVRAGANVVVGSSGLSDVDYEQIHEAAIANRVGVIAAGNFAIAAVLLARFAAEAARHFKVWEVIDYSSDLKPDAPSGTVRELVNLISKSGRSEPEIAVDETQGEQAARGAELSGMQVHSIRVPGFVIGAEVLFGGEDQRLSIRYDGGAGSEPYIGGTLLAIRKVIGRQGLTRGLGNILEEND